MNGKIISIVGLTASGKSALGIHLAERFNGEIISCDSRQVYKGLDIGSAKVTKEEQAMVRHHLLDVADPICLHDQDATNRFNVHDFQKLAYAAIDDILARGKTPILVGGSGLYSRSIVEGYEFSKSTKSNPKYAVLQICLMPPRDVIEKLVTKRIDERLAGGAIEETRELVSKGVDPDFLRSLGLDYFWNMELLDGKITTDEYRKQLAIKTMQFIKRQRTWFRKEKNTVYLLSPESFYEQSEKLILEFLNNHT